MIDLGEEAERYAGEKVTYKLSRRMVNFWSFCEIGDKAEPNLYLILPEIVGEGENKDYKYLIHSDGKIQLISYFGRESKIVIPDEIDGYPVAYLGEMLFGNDFVSSDTDAFGEIRVPVNHPADNITSVVLGKNVEVVFHDAFSNCDKLTDVSLNEGLRVLGGAFSNTALKGITLPSSLEIIGGGCFDECYELTGTVKIPSNVVFIGYAAFDCCEKLSNVILQEGVKYIQSLAFYRTRIKNITIPSTAVNLQDRIFSECKRLQSVHFAKTMKEPIEIPFEMFSECGRLSDVRLPDNVSKIGPWSFQCCHALTKITIPASVKEIADSAFSSDVLLKNVYFESKDCELSESELNTSFRWIHAPKGGTVEDYCKENLILRFVNA